MAPDANRPFAVHAGETSVRALGTEFNVRRFEPERAEVLVDEGRVEVRHGAHAVAVNAGEGASDVGGTLTVRSLKPDELTLKQSWRNGAIVFKDAPLGEVIAEINRYTYHRLMLRDPALAAKRVFGTLRPARADHFLEILTKSMHLRATIEPAERGVVILEQDGSAQ